MKQTELMLVAQGINLAILDTGHMTGELQTDKDTVRFAVTHNKEYVTNNVIKSLGHYIQKGAEI